MPPARRLPDDGTMLAHLDSGMTYQDIASRYHVSREAVRQRCVKMGVKKTERLDHRDFIPWKGIRTDHNDNVLLKRLREYSHLRQGRELAPGRQRLLEKWIDWMDGKNAWGVPLAVHYSWTDEEGFWCEPRRPGDKDYVSPPIEARTR